MKEVLTDGEIETIRSETAIEWGNAIGGPPKAALFARAIEKAVISAIAAQPEATQNTTPADWKFVPIEPTVEMTRAAAPWLAHIQLMRPVDRTNAINDAFRAMLNAAPKEPS